MVQHRNTKARCAMKDQGRAVAAELCAGVGGERQPPARGASLLFGAPRVGVALAGVARVRTSPEGVVVRRRIKGAVGVESLQVQDQLTAAPPHRGVEEDLAEQSCGEAESAGPLARAHKAEKEAHGVRVAEDAGRR